MEIKHLEDNSMKRQCKMRTLVKNLQSRFYLEVNKDGGGSCRATPYESQSRTQHNTLEWWTLHLPGTGG
jgi:hypothetical protein